MSKSKMNEYQDFAYSTSGTTLESNGRRETSIMAALGLTGEAGEVADIVKKTYYHGHSLNGSIEHNEKLCDELSDVLWYLAVMAKAAGYTLDEIADRSRRKLLERYPGGKFSAERSRNRDIPMPGTDKQKAEIRNGFDEMQSEPRSVPTTVFSPEKAVEAAKKALSNE